MRVAATIGAASMLEAAPSAMAANAKSARNALAMLRSDSKNVFDMTFCSGVAADGWMTTR